MKKLTKKQLKLDKEVVTSLSENELSIVKGGELNTNQPTCLGSANDTKCMECNLNTRFITKCIDICHAQSYGGGLEKFSCNPNDTCGDCILYSQGAGCAPSETCVNPNLTKEGCHIL